MSVARPVQSKIAFNDGLIDPSVVTIGTCAYHFFKSRIEAHLPFRILYRLLGAMGYVESIQGKDAAWSGEKQRIAPSAIAIGNQPAEWRLSNSSGGMRVAIACGPFLICLL